MKQGRKLKLTPEQIAEARKRREAGERLVDIGRSYGVSQSTISRICTGVRKKYRLSTRVKRFVRHTRHVRRKYRLNKKDYMKLFERQNGRCAICGREEWEFAKWLGVDHDHRTKRVRGLLCTDCNTGIGKFRDDPALLRKAIKYLKSTVQVV